MPELAQELVVLVVAVLPLTLQQFPMLQPQLC